VPAIPDLDRPLSNDRVSLRMFAERDIPEVLIAYQDDPELHLRLGEERPPSGAELGRYAERSEAARIAGDNITLTIVEPGHDECRGEVRVHNFDWDHGRAELGIWVAPQLRGRGMARAALRLVASWLFEACRLERVQLLTEPDNDAMIAAARAAGFTHEGVLRSYLRERGSRVDVAVLSLLPGDGGG
jgi:RimJ/RimL family protein N-acetyltransferase